MLRAPTTPKQPVRPVSVEQLDINRRERTREAIERAREGRDNRPPRLMPNDNHDADDVEAVIGGEQRLIEALGGERLLQFSPPPVDRRRPHLEEENAADNPRGEAQHVARRLRMDRA